MKHAVQVTILGQQYTVKTEADPAEVHKVAAFVNEKVTEISLGNKVVDTLNVAVLALMNLAGAHLRLREDLAGNQEAQQRLDHLLCRLEDALPGPGGSPSDED